MVTRLAGLALALALGACKPPPSASTTACPLQFTDEGNVRVLVVGHRVTLDDARSYEAFEQSFRRHLPALQACKSKDRPTLIVFPEDAGLVTWFLGRDGLFARGAADTGTAFNLLYAGLWRQTDAWRERYPEISPARALTLALSDRAFRAMDRTFAALAQDTGAWVITSANLPRVHESYDPGDMQFLDVDGVLPAYVATSPEVFNSGFVYDPMGKRVSTTDKVYLTDSEEGLLDLSNGALTALDVARLPFGNVGIAISRDAFYPTFTQRLDDLGAELVVQPEAFSGWTQEELPGDWLPEVILASSWATTQKYASTRFSAMPVLTGNLLSVVFDGQVWITSQAVPGGRAERLVGQPPIPGLDFVGAWAFDDELVGSLEERRARLRAAGKPLLPGGSKAGQTVDSLTGADLWLRADQRLPEREVEGDRSVEVAPFELGHQRNPAVVVDTAGTIWVAWSDTRTGVEQIWLAHSDDAAASWSGAQQVSPGARQLRPALAAGAAGHLVIAWQELIGSREQVRLAETRDGARFETHWLEETDAAQWEPAVALVDDAHVVVWTDFRDGLSSFIRVKCGATASFRADETEALARRANASQAQPALVGSSQDAITLAWIDYRDHRWLTRARSGAVCAGPGVSSQLSAPSEREVLAADVQLARAPSGEVLAAWDEIRDRRGVREVAAARWRQGTWQAMPAPPAVGHPRVRPSPVFDSEWKLVLQDQLAVKNGLTLMRFDGRDPQRIDETGAATNQLWQPRAVMTRGGLRVFFIDDRSGWRRVRVQ